MAIGKMTGLCLAGAILTLLPAATPAQSVEEFYKGRQINMLIGGGAGGGYDVYYRALARHLGHTLPLACYCLGALLPARRQTFSKVAALGVLAGGLLTRAAIFRAGNRSASEPRDYLGLTRAGTDGGGH